MNTPGQTGLKENTNMSPLVVGKALLIPRVKHWPQYGWRAELVIDDLAMGDVIISEFVGTREEAERAASQATCEAAGKYR
jgi:hypothetical protein